MPLSLARIYISKSFDQAVVWGKIVRVMAGHQLEEGPSPTMPTRCLCICNIRCCKI